MCDVRSLAARQQNLVTFEQLIALGIDKKGIARRIRDGRLTRLHRGVYLAAPLPAQFTSELAAVMACGKTAVLSHHSAAALYEIRPRHDEGIHVTVTRGQPRSRPGIHVHRARTLEATHRHGIPVTTPARTLLDLATVLPPRPFERAVEEAQLRRLVTAETLRNTPTGHHGTKALHEALAHEPRLTRSEAEAELLRLIRAAGLPSPLTNARVGRYEVDFLWPDHGLVVEMDGFAYHSSRHAFERDRLRDAELQAIGLRVVRVTWRQLAEPEALIARLAAALATARPPSFGPARTAVPGRR